jgi:ATP phosphoribosyltransferase
MTEPDRILKLGLPKGSLEKATLDLMARAGYEVQISDRSYEPHIDDPAIRPVILRPQEMSRYVEDGVLDAGLTGKDWIAENASKVHVVRDLVYAKSSLAKVRWVLAVPKKSKVRRAEDLEGGLVSTELVRVTQRYFRTRGVKVRVEFSHGATEIKPSLERVVDRLLSGSGTMEGAVDELLDARRVDAIVDVTETGASLKAHRLRVIDTVMESNTQFIANKQSWKNPWKRAKIENLAMLLQAVIDAKEMVGLKMNVPMELEEKIKAMLPAERSPTVSALADMTAVAMEVVLPAAKERELVPELKRAGATGIIVYPLNKIVH